MSKRHCPTCSCGNVEPKQLDLPPQTVLVRLRAWVSEACDDFNERNGGSAPGGRIGSALAPLVKKLGWENVRGPWQRYLAEKDPQFASAQDFAAHFGLWNGTLPQKAEKPSLANDLSVQAFLKGAGK